MAKKAAARKAKPRRLKTRSTKRASARKAAKSKPTYLKGTKSVDIPAHRVADVIKMIHDHGHGAKFKRQATAAGISMSLPPKTVNFVKDFVANNAMHAHPVARQVINSDGSYDCTS
jgi:hypothetical protein